MSARNGERARFNRNRKRKLLLRMRLRALLVTLKERQSTTPAPQARRKGGPALASE
jgi:hypothetical protein